jgi:hypothetical protein
MLEAPAGVARQGAAADNLGQETGAAAQQRQPRPRAERPLDRPPIGYIGVGSPARTQLGSMNLGPDIEAESARLVGELNNFLRTARTRRRPPPWQVGTAGEAPLPPPPRSDLGLRTPSGALPTGPLRPAPVAGSAQPRQFWQNLGGYEPPTLRLEDWRP